MKAKIDTLTEIDGAKVLEYLRLTLNQKRTGATRHIIAGQEQTEFHGLAICQYDGDKAYYLFYCDRNWSALTDTWHEDLESAKDQAFFEFTGLEGKWKVK